MSQAGVLVQDLHIESVVVASRRSLGLLACVQRVQVLQYAAEGVILLELTCRIVRDVVGVLAHACDLIALVAQNWTLHIEARCSTRLFARAAHLLDIVHWHASSGLHYVFAAAHHLAARHVLLLLRHLAGASHASDPTVHLRSVVDLRAIARLVIILGRFERTERRIGLETLVLREGTWVLEVVLLLCSYDRYWTAALVIPTWLYLLHLDCRRLEMVRRRTLGSCLRTHHYHLLLSLSILISFIVLHVQ